ncbi:hypothetical protein A2U01_0074104 [Trifolium medium]|uniref:Uncharacterized protein n=1 Tax=Trifolium medium TaxID=97028 RepID=A0A392SVF4_9FABA|nr:hypothetical protein [Trifolium medium]
MALKDLCSRKLNHPSQEHYGNSKETGQHTMVDGQDNKNTGYSKEALFTNNHTT